MFKNLFYRTPQLPTQHITFEYGGSSIIHKVQYNSLGEKYVDFCRNIWFINESAMTVAELSGPPRRFRWM